MRVGIDDFNIRYAPAWELTVRDIADIFLAVNEELRVTNDRLDALESDNAKLAILARDYGTRIAELERRHADA